MIKQIGRLGERLPVFKRPNMHRSEMRSDNFINVMKLLQILKQKIEVDSEVGPFHSIGAHIIISRSLTTSQAIAPQTGKVRTQAATISHTTPHRTAERRLDDPTPMMAVLMVWVVLTIR